jgi:hypothetical protein
VTPRLTSSFWVHALLRRCAGQGQFGAVVHKGAEEAGTVYVVINHLDGLYELLSPPPGPAYDEAGQRRFMREFEAPVAWQRVADVMGSRRRVDGDLWLVEIEDRSGLAGLEPIVGA